MLFAPVTNSVFGVPMWAARRDDYSFIITEEGPQEYFVTARRAYTTEPRPIRGQLIEIGTFPSMQKAIEACVKWKL